MENVTHNNREIEFIVAKARLLADSVEKLARVLDEGAIMLERKDIVAQVKARRDGILKKWGAAVDQEQGEKIGHNYGEAVANWTGLGSLLYRVASINTSLSEVSLNMMTVDAKQETPFGMVLISIGPKGLPEDIDIVCVSELARKSNRNESNIIADFSNRGCWLIDERTFIELVDNVCEQIMTGRLSLPASAQSLRQIQSPPVTLKLSGTVINTAAWRKASP